MDAKLKDKRKPDKEKEKEKEKDKEEPEKSVLYKPADLECRDLLGYLKTKPTNVIESLYNFPSICLAVYRYVWWALASDSMVSWDGVRFRELPEIARQFVIRILFVEQPVPQAVITSWTSQLYSK